MKTLATCIIGFTLINCALCFGQVDIYQSDAYSVEEMCAREAEQEQNESLDYGTAYDACISKNAEKPMYQTDRIDENQGSSKDGNVELEEHSEEHADES